MPRPLYVIGDVHGDADRLLRILNAHDLVDLSGGTVRFVKHDVVVVFMGDILDAKSRHGEFGDMAFRNTLSDLWILEFMRVAAREARAVGSEIVALIGNHELMNLRGEVQYVSPYHMPSPAARQRYFAPDGEGTAALAELFHTSIVYNGNHYSHAGIPLNATDEQKRFMGKRATAALLKQADNDHLESLVSHRDYADGAGDGDAAFRAATLCRRHNVKRMVTGHNYTAGQGVVSSFQGRVVYTDTGISKAFTPAHTPRALEIVYDPGDGELVVLKTNGTTAPIPEMRLDKL